MSLFTSTINYIFNAGNVERKLYIFFLLTQNSQSQSTNERNFIFFPTSSSDFSCREACAVLTRHSRQFRHNTWVDMWLCYDY